MAKDIDFFQKILIDRFGEMPAWVRVTTYLVCLLTMVYLTLCPSYIHGLVVVPGVSGVEQPYRDGAIEVMYESEGLDFDINEKGAFSVPVFSKLPWPPVELRVVRGDDRFPVPVSILNRLFPGRVKIYAHPGEPWTFSLEPPEAPPAPPAGPVASLLSRLGVGGSAHAQEPDGQDSPAGPDLASVNIQQIVDQAERLSGNAAATSGGKLGTDPVLRSLIVGAIEDEYQIAIPSHDWRKLRTIHDVTGYLDRAGFDLRVRKILRDFPSSRSIYLAPSIPSKKLENARQAAAVPRDEEVIGLLDATVFGSAKESMVFGQRGVYFRTSWTRAEGPRVGSLSYDQFPTRLFERSGLYEVSLGPDPRGAENLQFVVAGADLKATALADLLNQIRAAKQRQLLSATGWPASAGAPNP